RWCYSSVTDRGDARERPDLAVERKARDAPGDVIPQLARVGETEPGRVGEVPLDVALPRDDRARVAAPHRHDEVGPFDVRALQAPGHATVEVDANLAHDVDDHGVHLVGGLGARGAGGPAAALVERLRDLRAARVLDADEEDVRHPPSAPRRDSIASGTSR